MRINLDKKERRWEGERGRGNGRGRQGEEEGVRSGELRVSGGIPRSAMVRVPE